MASQKITGREQARLPQRRRGLTLAQAAAKQFNYGGIYDGHEPSADLYKLTKASMAARGGVWRGGCEGTAIRRGQRIFLRGKLRRESRSRYRSQENTTSWIFSRTPTSAGDSSALAARCPARFSG